MDVNLSLNNQLAHLGTAAHLILAMYNQDKGNFILVQTCFDVMSMIKNVYFSVVKTKINNPSGSFWIIWMALRRFLAKYAQWLAMIPMLINFSSQTKLMVPSNVLTSSKSILSGEGSLVDSI